MQIYSIDIEIPQSLEKILEILKLHGYEGFIVGGCVRDILLGLLPKDWDITTNAKPQQILKIFETLQHYKIITHGIKHGTLGIVVKKTQEIFEVTTYRIEGEYKDFRRPNNVTFTEDLSKDLIRRDFSINALACCLITHAKSLKHNNPPLLSINDFVKTKLDSHTNPAKSQTQTCQMYLYDYFNGIEDLKTKRLVCVGNPIKRFYEDALRIMRALRFLATLPFGFELEIKSKEALFMLTPLLEHISNERIYQEFKQLILGEFANQILLVYQSVFSEILPPLYLLKTTCYSNNIKALSYTPKDLNIRLALLLNPMQYFNKSHQAYFYLTQEIESYKNICEFALRNLRFENKTIIAILKILNIQSKIPKTKVEMKKLLFYHGKDAVFGWLCMLSALQKANKDLESLSYAMPSHTCLDSNIQHSLDILQEILENNECYSVAQLPINGTHIQQIAKNLNYTLKGKIIGRILNALVFCVIHEECLCNKDSLLKFLPCIIKQEQTTQSI